MPHHYNVRQLGSHLNYPAGLGHCTRSHRVILFVFMLPCKLLARWTASPRNRQHKFTRTTDKKTDHILEPAGSGNDDFLGGRLCCGRMRARSLLDSGGVYAGV
jgi:hypothetical protein